MKWNKFLNIIKCHENFRNIVICLFGNVHLGSKYLVRAQAKQQGQKCVWVSIKLNIHLELNHV